MQDAGPGARHFYVRLTQWPSYDAWFKQLRDLNIRLIWNMNEQELPSFVPFIKIIWDVQLPNEFYVPGIFLHAVWV